MSKTKQNRRTFKQMVSGLLKEKHGSVFAVECYYLHNTCMGDLMEPEGLVHIATTKEKAEEWISQNPPGDNREYKIKEWILDKGPSDDN